MKHPFFPFTEEMVYRVKYEVERKKKKTPFKKDASLNLNIPASLPFVQKTHYEIADFVKYHDTEFVRNVFIGILKREPDAEGFNYYLRRLRNGERTKVDIISAVRFSKEGRSQNVKILGIKKRLLLSVLRNAPVVGYFTKTLLTIATLPRLLKRINALEAQCFMNIKLSQERELALQNAFNSTNMEKTLQKISFLHENLDKKVDKNELESLYLDMIKKLEKEKHE